MPLKVEMLEPGAQVIQWLRGSACHGNIEPAAGISHEGRAPLVLDQSTRMLNHTPGLLSEKPEKKVCRGDEVDPGATIVDCFFAQRPGVCLRIFYIRQTFFALCSANAAMEFGSSPSPVLSALIAFSEFPAIATTRARTLWNSKPNP